MRPRQLTLGISAASSPTFVGLTLSGLSSGQVLFAGVGGLIDQDPKLAWDDTNKRLRVGSDDSPNATAVGMLNLVGETSYRHSLRVYDDSDVDARVDLAFYRARGTIAAPTTVLVGDTLGAITWDGYHAGASWAEGAKIDAAVDGARTTYWPTTLRFKTSDANNSFVTRLSINSSGNLILPASTPTVAGHFGMDTVTGRLNAFIDGKVRKVAGSHESQQGPRFLRTMYFNAGTQTAAVMGMATQTSIGTQANIHTTDAGEYLRYTSSGVIDTDAGWSPDAYDHTRRRYDPIWEAGVMAATTQTNTRVWFGMFSGDPMASATPALHYAAFRYDTATDGTAFWRCCTDDGVGAPTVTVTTVGYTALVGHRLKIVMDSLASTPAVRFYIDDVLVATHTTDLPGIDTDLAHHEELRDTAGAARQIHVNKVVWSAWAGPQ